MKMITQNIKITGLNLKQLLLITASFGITSVGNAALFDCVSEPGVCIGEGDTVIFRFEGTESKIGLFGTVHVIGDSIVSYPTDFRAETADGNGTVFTSDNGTVQVMAKPGYQIEEINIVERGDYRMTGAGASVDVDGLASAADWDDQFFGAYTDQTLSITGDLTIADGDIHTWMGTASLDLSGTIWDSVDSIALSLQNNLQAFTAASGETAWIEKKFSGSAIDLSVVTVIPVPAAAWLFGSGLIGLVGVARRKK